MAPGPGLGVGTALHRTVADLTGMKKVFSLQTVIHCKS